MALTSSSHSRSRHLDSLDTRQLLQNVPLCERTILNLEKRGQFPRRFTITSRLLAWDLNEVDAWIAEQQKAARLPGVPQAHPVPRRPSK